MNTTEEQIKKVLTKTTQKCGFEDFEMIEVKCLNKKFDADGEEIKYHSKSYKIVVPHRCRNAMDSNEIFPQGWNHRRWDVNRNRGGGV